MWQWRMFDALGVNTKLAAPFAFCGASAGGAAGPGTPGAAAAELPAGLAACFLALALEGLWFAGLSVETSTGVGVAVGAVETFGAD